MPRFHRHLFVAFSFAWALAATAQSPTPQSPQSPQAPPTSPAGAPSPMMMGSEFGFAIFEKNCTGCHGNPAVERAPSPAQLREFTAERIYAALTTGPMKAVGDTLQDWERRRVAESLAGKPIGAALSGAASEMPNRCSSDAGAGQPGAFSPSGAGDWNGWGADLDNTRFKSASDAGLSADGIPKLKLKWAFGLPNATSSYSQPTVVGGRLFVGTDTGYIYSINAKSGCVYWSYLSKSGVRNAMTIAPVHGHGSTKYAVYYGDLKSNVYALDAATGALLWTRKVEENYTNRITAAPAFYHGKLYVPVSSFEEFSASSPTFQCCTSVGAVVALAADSGQQLWKRYVISERPKPVRKNAAGVQQWAPAGGSVWNTPTLDPKRNALYIGTGDATTYPAAPTSDSVMALNMTTGKVLWSYQVHKNDSFVGGCWGDTITDNCPKVQGPDWDIPASIIMRTVANQDYLVVGTKPGDILALNPDKKGELFWRKNVHGGEIAGDAPKGPPMGPGPARVSGVLWGGAADMSSAYFGLSGVGGVAAMRIVDGDRQWFNTLGHRDGPPAPDSVSNGAATTAITGVVFVGGTDGQLTALSASDGKVLWKFDTHREFDAVNKVATHGGSISSAGAVVADGMLYVGSGYSVVGGTPGNALLAFGTE